MLQEIRLIRIEYNNVNGFIFELLSFDIHLFRRDIDTALFSINFSSEFIVGNILFKSFEIFDRSI